MSPTPTPPVYYPHPRRLVWVQTLRPSPKLQGLGCRDYPFEAHLCGSYVHCDLPVPTPCLLSTPPRGDAVGTVCGAEPSNCTDGTCTRVDVRFAGARIQGPLDSQEMS